MNPIVLEFINNQYEMVETLHESGKSTILLVKNKKTSEQFVLKRLRGSLDVYLKLKKLSHPLLPKIIYAAVETDETIVVEEHIKGVPIGAEPLPEKDALSILLQLCDVLGFLHSNGIIHRDIKPTNVLLTENKEIRLIDFDAARLEKESTGQDTELLGTRGYASPEQYGFAQTSPRSDIYALGITMNKLLGLRANDDKYKKIIAKCTDLNPDKRYKDASEVSKALSAKPKNQNWLVYAGLAIVAVVLCVLIVKNLPTASSNLEVELSTIPQTAQPSEPASVQSRLYDAYKPAPINAEEDYYDYLFYTEDMNYIYLDGYSIVMQGETAEMSVDLDGDGTEERFEISRDNPNGIKLMGYSSKYKTNFYCNDWWDSIPATVDTSSAFCAQISCCDLDDDGTMEVLISVGDNVGSAQVTAIYRYTGVEDVPFVYKGIMQASSFILLNANNELIGPVGFNGQANAYKYDDGTLMTIQ